MRIDGRKALVVGGAGGLGAAIVDVYTAAGADVVVADRRPAQAPHPSVAFDITDESAVAEGVSEARELLGGQIDILVNAAGITSESDMSAMPPDMWRRTIDVDLTGVFLACQQVIPEMVERRWGRIINIASQLGLKGASGMAHYAAAKAGVIAMTKSLALEVSKHNVLANVIAPGPFHTPLLDGLSEEWQRAKMAELPLGRFGQPEEVAPSALMLANDPAGNLYVGQVLGPNSGDVMP